MSKVLVNACWILPLILLNAIFFAAGGTDHSTSQWVSYSFINLAILTIPATALTLPRAKGLTVLSGTMWVRDAVYVVSELCLGVVFIVVNPTDPTWVAIAQTALFVAFTVWQISAIIANRATAASIEKQRRESLNVRMLTEMVKNSGRSISDENTRSLIFRCAENISFLSIESFPQTEAYELALRDAVNELCATVDLGAPQEQIVAATSKVTLATRSLSSAVKLARLS